jgi:hypothetical protein
MNQQKPYFIIAILVLVLATLACNFITGQEDVELLDATSPPATETPIKPDEVEAEKQAPTKPPEVEEAPSPETPANEDEYRSDGGGYSFTPIPDYTLDEFYGITNMQAPDADPDFGPAVMMMGGTNEEEKSADQLYDEFTADLESNVEVVDTSEITIDGVRAILVEVEGEEEGQAMVGRVIIAAVTPTQQFTLFATAPKEKWEALDPLAEALVATIRFFEPSEDLGIDEGEGDDDEPVGDSDMEVLMNQWAVDATASSQYGSDGWSAAQATGPQDTLECGDTPSAWASQGSDTVEWLELTYGTPVRATMINIIQTHSPDQVIKVEIFDPAGSYLTVYTGIPEEKGDECPYTLSVPVDEDMLVYGVKITIDQSVIPATWNEIDAVELVGYASSEEAPLPPATVPEAPPTGGASTDDLEPGEFNYIVTSETEYGIVESGEVQDQSTAKEYIIGLVSTDYRYSATLFIPHTVSATIIPMLPYEMLAQTKGPSGTIYIGMDLYTADEGVFVIEAVEGDTISGTFYFSATNEDDPDTVISVVGAFNQLPLVKK